MRAGQTREVLTPVIVDNDVLPVPLLQRLLAFFGGGQVRQTGRALLESLPVESVAAVDVDGSLDMTDIVGDERSAVEQQKVAVSMFTVRTFLEFLGETVVINSPGLVEDQGPLEGVALAVQGRGWEAHGGGHRGGEEAPGASAGH